MLIIIIDIQKVILSIPDRHITRKLLKCKPIPEAIHIITLSDANKSGPYFCSTLSKLNALYPEALHNGSSTISGDDPKSYEDVLEDLETLNFTNYNTPECEEISTNLAYTSSEKLTYTPLPDSLDLQELVSLSFRIKSELRELLFMLDNNPNYLDDGGLDTIQKRNSIQRHKNSGSQIERKKTVKSDESMNSEMNFEDLDNTTTSCRFGSTPNSTTYRQDSETFCENFESNAHEKRKSIQGDINSSDYGLERRKSLRSNANSTKMSCNINGSSGIDSNFHVSERVEKLSMEVSSVPCTTQRRGSILREFPAMSVRRKSVQRDSRPIGNRARRATVHIDSTLKNFEHTQIDKKSPHNSESIQNIEHFTSGQLTGIQRHNSLSNSTFHNTHSRRTNGNKPQNLQDKVEGNSSPRK